MATIVGATAVALIAAVAGGVAAADHHTDPDSYDVGPTYENASEFVGTEVWVGQQVTIGDTDPESDGYMEASGVEVHEEPAPGDTNESTDRVTTLQVFDGQVELDSSVYLQAGTIYHLVSSDDHWDGAEFWAAEEGLQTNFHEDGPEKENDGSSLEFHSDRDVQTVNVTETAGLLDAGDLDEFFPDLEHLDSMHDDDAVFTAEVGLDGANSVDLDAMTDAVGAAEYELEFDVTDSVAVSSSTLVGEGETTPGVEYTLELEAGVTQTVGFPGPVNGTYGEVFPAVDGSLAAYDANTGAWETPDRDQEIEPLDAVVITPGEDVTIAIPFEAGDDGSQAAPSERELATGWNFVAPPQYGGAGTAYTVGTADVARVLDVYERPGARPFADGDDFGVYTVGDPTEPRVSAFAGYWTYVEGDGTVAVNLYEGMPADEIPELLDS